MKNRILNLIVGCLVFASCAGPESGSGENNSLKEDKHEHIVQQVSFQDVIITDNFWQPKIEINRVASIRHALLQDSQSIENFDIAAGKKSSRDYKARMASDSDVYKIIQGAAYALHHTPDKELEATIDSVIDRIVAAQQPDGYLITYIPKPDSSKRWIDLRKSHELYCAGHLIEAAVAYFEVTGKRKFLDAAIRFADCIDAEFGPGKRQDATGHEEIELALFKLYKITGEKRYLDLTVFFIDERGNPKRMIVEKITPPDRDPNANTPQRWRPPSYMQDHLPVTQQYYAVGHAVCASYLYSAVTDVAMEKGETKYLPALDSIWNNIVRKKLYITGGIGTRQFHDEGFGSDYLLPNDRAYCETCSGIGFTFWNRRMCLMHGNAKYADLTELTMFNAALAGVSLSGDRFFYTNPLESNGEALRKPYFDPPCCPTNIVRFLPEIGSTIYGKTDKGIYVNQFIGNKAKISVGGQQISIEIETDYPWDGRISLNIDPEKPAGFRIHIRIPGWAQGELLPGGLYKYFSTDGLKENVILKVNGEKISKIQIERGYAVINRKWEKGDKLELELPMKVQLVVSNPKISDNQGKVVLTRGPFIYCIEETDNKNYFDHAADLFLVPNGLKVENRNDLLDGVSVISGIVSSQSGDEKIGITAVPYYAWCNREPGRMKVWLPGLID